MSRKLYQFGNSDYVVAESLQEAIEWHKRCMEVGWPDTEYREPWRVNQIADSRGHLPGILFVKPLPKKLKIDDKGESKTGAES